MLIQRQRRLIFITIIVFAVSLAAGLILFALKQNINLFYTPTQILNGEAPKHHAFRIGGMVVKGSVKHQNNLEVSFVLTDLSHQIKINYNGILPDLFREGQGIVAQGQLNNQSVFIADQVLAKHDEKYMPPQVASALKVKQSKT